MKKYYTFSFFLCFLATAIAQPLKSDWVKIDKKNFHQINNFISSQEYTLSNLQRMVPELSRLNRNAGWSKIWQLDTGLYGGYTFYRVRFIAKDDQIVQIQISLSEEDSQILKLLALEDQSLQKALNQNWKLITTFDQLGEVKKHYEFRFRDVAAEQYLLQKFTHRVVY